MSKRFYWLKMPKEFFQSLRIKKLRRLAGGDTYTIIYLKMLLKYIETEGLIEFSGLEDLIAEEIALEIDEDAENVEVTIAYLLRTGLMIENADGTFELPYAATMTGSETSNAKRTRACRERKQKSLETSEGKVENDTCNSEVLHCNTDVTQVKQNCNVEIEKEIDIEKEILSNESIKKSASGDADSLPEEQPKKSRFKAPTVDEVKAYANEKGLTKLDANTFVDYYESKGWYVGKSKMKDWKAAARNWNSRQKSYDRDIPRNRSSGFKNFTERDNEDLLELERKLLG